jgi:hypothetical protein
MPTQDKLRVLADWLQVSPDELRFGRQLPTSSSDESELSIGSMNMADREMVHRYLALSVNDRKTVRDVVAALVLAAANKKTP